jgi:hypothetical protein
MYNTKHKVTASKIGGIQGDVPFRYVEKLPANVKPAKSNIVAYGEVTGHHHIVEEAQMFTDDLGNLFALVEKPTRLLHHEHGVIELEPGVIQFGKDGVQQVEYDGEEERRVLD